MLEDTNSGQKLGDADKGEQQFPTCFDEQELRVFVNPLDFESFFQVQRTVQNDSQKQ